MSWSAKAFKELVWPLIEPMFGGGQLDSLEGKDVSMLDMYAGIDAWHINMADQCVRGIASRVQQDPCRRMGMSYPYNTFSIRIRRVTNATELEKRLAALRSDRGWIYPHLTVHAYLNEHRTIVVSGAIVETRPLYEFYDANRSRYTERLNQDHESWFVGIPFGDLLGAGIKVKRFNSPRAVARGGGGTRP